MAQGTSTSAKTSVGQMWRWVGWVKFAVRGEIHPLAARASVLWGRGRQGHLTPVMELLLFHITNPLGGVLFAVPLTPATTSGSWVGVQPGEWAPKQKTPPGPSGRPLGTGAAAHRPRRGAAAGFPPGVHPGSRVGCFPSSPRVHPGSRVGRFPSSPSVHLGSHVGVLPRLGSRTEHGGGRAEPVPRAMAVMAVPRLGWRRAAGRQLVTPLYANSGTPACFCAFSGRFQGFCVRFRCRPGKLRVLHVHFLMILPWADVVSLPQPSPLQNPCHKDILLTSFSPHITNAVSK